MRFPITDIKDIHLLVPHREPMLFIDTIVCWNSTLVVSSFRIPSEGVFIEDGKFTEAGLIENMAQTAAAYMGYSAKQEGGDSKIGFIAAIKEVNIESLPNVSEVITTTIEIVHNVMGMLLIKGRIMMNNTLIASSEMKTVLQA